MANKCDQCFYALMDKESEAPCVTCRGYSNFVSGTVYATDHSSKPLKEAIDDWFKNVNGLTQEDYDSVTKPRHYMLFDEDAVISYEGKGIEVRDVIEQLMKRIYTAYDKEGNTSINSSPMFDADYVQMMQYLMRFMDKNGVEDLNKARWYLDKLIDSYEHHV
jgi:hypothetical protein